MKFTACDTVAVKKIVELMRGVYFWHHWQGSEKADLTARKEHKEKGVIATCDYAWNDTTFSSLPLRERGRERGADICFSLSCPSGILSRKRERGKPASRLRVRWFSGLLPATLRSRSQ
jgi:hypothetical protein